MRSTFLVISLLAASSRLHGANIANVFLFGCGAIAGNVVNNNNGTWALSVTCLDGATFVGTAAMIDSGDPSDLRIQGTFRDNPGGALTDNYDFSLNGFTLPVGPNVTAWHVLQGSMNLGGNQGANPLAELIATNGILIGANGTCTVSTPPIADTGMINGAFAVSSLPGVQCMDTPNWTRGVTLVASFNAGVAVNGSITLGAGASDNFFEGAPEPATWAPVTIGLLLVVLAARRRNSAKH